MKQLNDKYQKIKVKIEDTEAEIERYKMQIKELSNKIDSEPEKNNVQKVIENPKGSVLILNLTEIAVSENIKNKWASLSFSV